MPDEEKKAGIVEVEVVEEFLGLVPSAKGDGSYDLTLVQSPADLQEPRKRREPWKVGVTDQGEDVYAPIAGPNAAKALPLKFDVGVCKVCRCTVHRRSAVVDPQANIYCKACWPYCAFSDPREPQPLPEHTPELPETTAINVEGEDVG